MPKMIDIYGPLSAGELDALILLSVDTFGGYLGRKSMGFNKAMTQEYVALIKERGKQVVSIYQDKNNYAAYFTFNQGVLDGARAFEDAKWLGQPYNTPIYFPVDFDAQAHDLAAINAYLQGVRRSLAGAYKLGLYGSFFVVENITADFYGQTAAWSSGRISARAHWYQGQIDTKMDGLDVDIDTVRGDIGAWPEAYASVKVKVNGTVYPAIDVDGDTHIIWTAFKDAGEKITKDEYTDVEIGGVKPHQVGYQKNTYIIYTAFTNMDHEKVGDTWVFTTKKPATPIVAANPISADAQVLLQKMLGHLPENFAKEPTTNTYIILKAVADTLAESKI